MLQGLGQHILQAGLKLQSQSTSAEPSGVRVQDAMYRQACGSWGALAPLLPHTFMIFSGTNSASCTSLQQLANRLTILGCQRA